MKEALNSMHPRSAPSVAPAPNVARDDDDDDEPAPALSGVDNAKIILVQVLGGIGRQDVIDANLEKQLRLLTDDAALAYAQYVRGQDPRALWGLGPGLQAWLLEGISNSAAPHERRAAAIAAAEAECRAALEAAARPEKVIVTPDSHPRVHRALSAFVDAVVLDAADDENLRQYLRRQGKRVGSHEIIKVIKRWPRIRKYWPRLRRRVCWGCGKQYDLSEPRLWVCGGCGDARYCNEACQAADWPDHKSECLQTWHAKAIKRKSQGEPWEKLHQEFVNLYDGDG